MNKLFIILLAVCLVSVHAFVKRDAPKAAENNMLDDLSKRLADAFEDAKKQLDPEKLKAQWDEVVKKVQPVIEGFSKPAEAKP